MLTTRHDAVVVQGITGKQGSFWTERMREVGTNVVAGVSPGKGGRQAAGVPVYDSVTEAARQHPIEASVLFVPPMAAKSAALDAIAAGVRDIVFLTEHVPYQDVMHVLAEARDAGARVLGPNTAGLVLPGRASLGIMPAFAENIFRPGSIGVVSRSGSLGTLLALNLVTGGYGESVFLGIGGDPILGTTTLDAVRMLDADPRTEAVVLVGEIGGTMEEDAAGYIAGMSKPVVAFIAGRSAPPERRMGHAGAIVSAGKGDGASKVATLREAGVTVLDVPSQVTAALAERGVLPAEVCSGT
ncbi:succinate--CoA ligase subunit alpha [Sciscionella marina]|uniref:succinate--CoA ligase subunit alpha n=1 Tax=Sciscionella marina TaxID=508770 RepID=UPI000377D262|nr:CoA-binding protein [Sciscionella marina]